MTKAEATNLLEGAGGRSPGQALAERLARGGQLRIAIATDGSPFAQTATAVAGDLARTLHAEVIVLVAFQDEQEAIWKRGILDEARELLGELEPPAKTVQLIGFADEVIIEHLAASPVDLLVIGAFGDRGTTRFLTGSTAQRLVSHAPPSVLMVKDQRPAFGKILACTAFGDEVVVDVAAQLAKALQAEVKVLHVVPPTAAMYMALPDTVQVPLADVLAQDTPLARHLSGCVNRLEAMGLDGDIVMVRRGAVPDVIFEEARAGAFDMIVVGSRAGHPRDSYFIGSTADRVAKHAHRSVLVVRTESDRGAASG